MSHIHVNFKEVARDNKDINKLANKLNSIERDLDNIGFWISRKIKNRNGIEARLDSTINSIDQLEKQLRSLYAFIDESMESYKNAENKINALKLDGIDEKSWEKLGEIADVVGDSIKGFALGAKDAVVSTWDGLVSIVTNPEETLEGLAYVIQNPGEALSAARDAIVESWNTQVINGDAESRGKFFGRAFGEVALAVVGTKGVDKAVKAAKGTKIVQEAANGYKVVKSDVANKVGNMKVPVRVRQEVLATPDGRKFSMWNVETKPARELYQKFTKKGNSDLLGEAKGPGAASRFGERKISDELYDELRKQTPTDEIRDMVNEGVELPKPDPAIPGKMITTRLEADHIVPMDRIARMEGFEKLSNKQQLEVLNYEKNFTGLSKVANTSKGSKSFEEWTMYKKEAIPVDKGFRETMIQKEKILEIELQEMIKNFLK